MENKRIWIRFKGKAVRRGRIEVLKLGDFLSNFQRLIFEYGKAKGIKKPQEHLKLYLAEIKPGSVIAVTEPVWPYKYYTAPIEEAIGFVLTLIEHVSEYSKVKALLEKEYPDPNLRIKTLKRLRNMWSSDDLMIDVGIGVDEKPPERYVSLPPEKVEVIDTLLKDFMKEFADRVNGAIVEMKFYGKKRHFEIMTTDGERIRCYYDPNENPDLEDKVYENAKKPVTVFGTFKQEGKRKVIENVFEIQEWNVYPIKDKFAGYKLKKPIELKIEYDNNTNVWCVENLDLELYGCGKTFDEALKDAEVVFEALIEGYALEDDEELDEGAKKLKRKLLEYVEVSQ